MIRLTEKHLTIAFFFFIALGYAIFGKMWHDGYRIKPCNLDDTARFQARYYWRLYRREYPHSYLPEACLACVVIAFAIVVFGLFFISN